jgi:hypothetical protein
MTFSRGEELNQAEAFDFSAEDIRLSYDTFDKHKRSFESHRANSFLKQDKVKIVPLPSGSSFNLTTKAVMNLTI